MTKLVKPYAGSKTHFDDGLEQNKNEKFPLFLSLLFIVLSTKNLKRNTVKEAS